MRGKRVSEYLEENSFLLARHHRRSLASLANWRVPGRKGQIRVKAGIPGNEQNLVSLRRVRKNVSFAID